MPRATEAQFLFRSRAGEDAPQHHTDLGGGLGIPPRIPHRRGAVGPRPAPLQRDGKDVRRRLRGLDVILVDDQEILGPRADDAEICRNLIWIGGGREHRADLEPADPVEEFADAMYRTDRSEAALVGLAMPLPGGLAVALLPLFSGDSLDVQVAALADLAAQGLVIDLEAKRGKGFPPRRNVLCGVVHQRSVDIEEENAGPHACIFPPPRAGRAGWGS